MLAKAYKSWNNVYISCSASFYNCFHRIQNIVGWYISFLNRVERSFSYFFNGYKTNFHKLFFNFNTFATFANIFRFFALHFCSIIPIFYEKNINLITRIHHMWIYFLKMKIQGIKFLEYVDQVVSMSLLNYIISQFKKQTFPIR